METKNVERASLPADYRNLLFKRHFQGALVRSGASLIMGVVALIGFYTGTISFLHLAGVGVSILFVILINPPTLWILKKIKSRFAFKYFSMFINLLEIIGYTGIIHSLGGIEASYLTLLYAGLIVYVGTVGPKKLPFIVAALCSPVFFSMVILEYQGYLPDRSVITGFGRPLINQLLIASVVTGLLFVVAYITAFTSGILNRTRDKLNRKNVELLAAVRRLEDSEKALRTAHGELENRVKKRTAELSKANKELALEIKERKRAEGEREKLILELTEALEEVKTLSGLLPICASCKKIRDDSGYWNQIESYLSRYSEAEFTHSICPDCSRKLYPGLKMNDDN